jgi:hypothetical protein
MLEHDDMKQDADMIKSVLQKIIDDMNEYEADRIMPEERKPKAAIVEVSTEEKPEESDDILNLYKGSYGISKSNENKGESVEQAEPENQFNQHDELDPTILTELLKKAEEADEDGVLPEERENDLPLELAKLVREKKEKLNPK